MKDKYMYQRNIDLIGLFYESDFYSNILSNEKFAFKSLKSLINAMYVDPDISDRELIIPKIIFENFANKNISLGLDGLCGWKLLYDFRKGGKEWLDDYKIIRGSKHGYLIWPNSTDNRSHPTINQLRYLIFADRIDYTLFDIKLYFADKEEDCKLTKAYKGKTKDFLDSFKKEGENGFENFIKGMNLDIYVHNNEIKKLDAKEKGISYLTKDDHKNFSHTDNWNIESKKIYTQNILDICKRDKLPII